MSAERNQADELTRTSTHDVPWLCVAGAKGGVGKTMLACNIGLLMAKAGYRTLLVDFDPGTGNVAVQLRLQGRHDIDDVAANRCSVRDAIVQGPGRLQVLPGRSGPTDLHRASPAEYANLFRALRSASGDFDLVIFDTGAGLNACTMAVAAQCDVTLGVTTPEVTALTDAYALAKLMHQSGLELPRLVINRTRSRDEAMRTAGKLDTVTERFLGCRTELAGWVADDRQIERSIREQRPLTLFGDCAGLDDLRSLCASVLATLPAMKRGLQPAEQSMRRVRLRPARL